MSKQETFHSETGLFLEGVFFPVKLHCSPQIHCDSTFNTVYINPIKRKNNRLILPKKYPKKSRVNITWNIDKYDLCLRVEPQKIKSYFVDNAK